MERKHLGFLIEETVRNASSIDEVKTLLISLLRKIRQDSNRIGYVAGLITSEGPENIDKNVRRLVKFTSDIRSENNFPIFASTDVISDALFKKIGADAIKSGDWEKFWRAVLAQGGVTDVFMTPRWEISRGATDEYNTAKSLGLQIHFVTGEV